MGQSLFLRYVKYYENFVSLYLGDRSRYRDKTKSEFNGIVFSISRQILMIKFLIFPRIFLHEKSKLKSFTTTLSERNDLLWYKVCNAIIVIFFFFFFLNTLLRVRVNEKKQI